MFKLELANILQKKVFSGKFGADMQIKLVNDGPVTIIIDTKKTNSKFTLILMVLQKNG